MLLAIKSADADNDELCHKMGSSVCHSILFLSLDDDISILVPILADIRSVCLFGDSIYFEPGSRRRNASASFAILHSYLPSTVTRF